MLTDNTDGTDKVLLDCNCGSLGDGGRKTPSTKLWQKLNNHEQTDW